MAPASQLEAEITPTPTPRTWTRHIPAILFLAAASILLLRSHVYFGPKQIHLAQIHLLTLAGTPIPPQTVRNQPILLNLWAPWCPPCRAELPALQRLQQQHPQALVIGLDDDPDTYPAAQALARELSISYLTIRTSPALHDALGTVTVLPTTLFISPSGKVVHSVSGPIPESLMRHYLEQAIATP